MSERDCGNDAAAYALGALEPTEAEAFERHLESCAVCRDELVAFSEVVAALPLSAPSHPLPRGLRRRVLRSVRAELPAKSSRRPRSIATWTVRRIAVAALAASFAVGLTVGLNSAGGPRLVRASVGQATLRVSSDHAELIVEHLPPPSNRRIYEMWLQRGSGPPQPSTLFSVNSADHADIGVPGELKGLTRVLVTEEPAGGSSRPSGPPVIVARLG
ncbi:MAG TPA: anti-sigma factor [Solirubrobacteraceae bacterium]|jgi:anti-sigma factor RsiW